jgi:DNA topoisomerase-3
MLNGEKTELITGFRSSRTYRLFDAYLSLDQQGKIAFSFPPRRVKGRRKKGEPVDEEA